MCVFIFDKDTAELLAPFSRLKQTEISTYVSTCVETRVQKSGPRVYASRKPTCYFFLHFMSRFRATDITPFPRGGATKSPGNEVPQKFIRKK